MLKQFARSVTGPEDEIPEGKLQAILKKVQAGSTTVNFGQMLCLLADEIKVCCLNIHILLLSLCAIIWSLFT